MPVQCSFRFIPKLSPALKPIQRSATWTNTQMNPALERVDLFTTAQRQLFSGDCFVYLPCRQEVLYIRWSAAWAQPDTSPWKRALHRQSTPEPPPVYGQAGSKIHALTAYPAIPKQDILFTRRLSLLLPFYDRPKLQHRPPEAPCASKEIQPSHECCAELRRAASLNGQMMAICAKVRVRFTAPKYVSPHAVKLRAVFRPSNAQ